MPQSPAQQTPFAGQGRLSWALRRFWRARARPLWRELRAPLVIVLALSVVVLGTIGFTRPNGGGYAWWEALFRSLELFGLGGGDISGASPLSLNIARVLGPLLVGYAAVRGLLVISREQLRLLGFRLFRRNHIVVAGLGDVGFRLAASLNELGARVIAIDRDQTKPSIEGCRERGISVIVGDAADPDLLRTACVDRAGHLIVAPGADGVTIDVVAAAGQIVGDRAANPLQVFAQIEDRVLWKAMEARALSEERDPGMKLELFNLYESAGRLLLREHPPFAEPEAGERRAPRVLVVSDQPIGEILVVNTARMWQNARAHGRSRIEIEIARPDAEAECERIRARYPAIDEICRLEPWQLDLGSPVVRDDDRVREASAVYVALVDEAQGVATSLLLAGASPAAEAVVLVINDERLGAASIASADERTGRIAVFGILSRALEPGFLLNGLSEIMARAMHESYLRDQLTKGETSETLPNLQPWDELPEDTKAANRDFAAAIPAKMAEVGRVVVPVALVDLEHSDGAFDDAEVERLAEAEHARWMGDRIRAGFSYGPERVGMAHPSLVPYGELPEAEKDKDRVAVRDLPRMLAAAGFAIQRVEQP